MLFENKHEVPVLLLAFNRPQLTQQILNAIAISKPKRLYIAADGPRENNLSDKKLCAETRELFDNLSWNCTLITRFLPTNLGCKLAVSSAIDWFFENEEAGIILEDDCLPLPIFFDYCFEMLNRYANEKQVMHIAGSNLLLGHKAKNQKDYYYSRYPNIWGWASWRRAWLKYDVNLTELPALIDKMNYRKLLPDYWQALSLIYYLKQVLSGKINTWDYQWMYTVVANFGLAIIPTENLVKNIGFSNDSTHSWRKNNVFSKVNYGKPPTSWQGYQTIAAHNYLDAYYFYNIYRKGLSGKLKLAKLAILSIFGK